MNKKTMMILALACLISLGIGVVIGYGLNVQNLSGTAAAPNEITSIAGSYNFDGQQYDLETLMMKLQTKRADAVDSQLTEQVIMIKERNALLAEAQKILSEARSLRPSKDTDKAKMTATIAEFCNKQNIKIVGAVGADLKQSEWDQNIESIKAFIEQLNTASQQEMIKLQELTTKRDQAYAQMTDLMAKYSKTTDEIIRNMR